MVAAGLIIGAGLIWHSTEAAFTATTATGANTFAAGTVSIADNRAGAALFTLSNLGPGDTGSVTPTAIKLYTNAAAAQEQNNGGGYVAWTNGTTAEMDDSSGTAGTWGQVTLSFNTGANTTVTLLIGSGTAQYDVYVDDISLS